LRSIAQVLSGREGAEDGAHMGDSNGLPRSGPPAVDLTWTLDAILLAHPTTIGGPFTNVDQTDALNEADGRYLLECTLLDVPPKHRKTIRIGF
jgi:hypothetical protein